MLVLEVLVLEVLVLEVLVLEVPAPLNAVTSSVDSRHYSSINDS